MNKIILKDGTELIIENGATESCIAVVTEDLSIVDTYVKALTKENLTTAEIINESGEVTLTLRDKYITGFDGTDVKDEEGKYIVCFRFADVYTIAERISRLEASQEIQDEAITEIAGIIAE